MELRDFVAVVTGGSSGLGLATASRLVTAGAQVVVLDRQPPLEESPVHFVRCDVTDPAAVRRGFERAAELGPVRVVVSCAGIGDPQRVLDREGAAKPLEPFHRVVSVNLVGTFTVVSTGAEFIARSSPVQGERGVIVNTASVAAFDGQVGQAAYSASKGGIAAMTLPLARDLAQSLIRVVAVAPGIFRTPLLGTLPEAAQDALGEAVPHPRRLGEPDEFAALVEHIVRNPMLNGEVIRLDGALRMGPR